MGNEKKSGCGLFNAVFRRKSRWPRRSTSTGSLPPPNVNGITRSPSTPEIARGAAPNGPGYNKRDRKQPETVLARPINNQQARRKVPQTRPGISGELESVMADYQKSNGPRNLLRASSGNVMLYANLGNLRQPVKSNNDNDVGPEKPDTTCRALSTTMDPEELKILGNEDYKNGRFSEALAMYDAAISVDPNKASYRSNKSAALVALGKLLEAAFECREAIRIDPFYQRAHNRLATIYVRLGEVEKAMHHFKQSGSEADPDSMEKAKRIQLHLNKCTEAKRQRDWNTIANEAGQSIAAGADSAPLIFGLRAEALLRLNKQEEAIESMEKGPNFDVDSCTKLFGPIGTSSLLIFRAQVDLAAGRFDDALARAQRASRLDPGNKEADSVTKRIRAVANARTNGNEMFKGAKYSEAIVFYGEGLSSDPYNATLLCNRAACRSKLSQYEKAIEDCSSALRVRSGYGKARLRRADCYAKMRKWGECVKDCEVLIRENPGDEEILKILEVAKRELGKNEVL